MIAIIIIFPLVLLLFAVFAQLAGAGVVPPNHFAGIRIPSVMKSQAAWQAGHSAAAPWAWAGWVVATLAAAGALVFGESTSTVLGVVVLAVFFATLVAAFIAANAAARSA